MVLPAVPLHLLALLRARAEPAHDDVIGLPSRARAEQMTRRDAVQGALDHTTLLF